MLLTSAGSVSRTYRTVAGGAKAAPMRERYWALYLRVSTQEQASEGVSLDAQEAKCRMALRLEVDDPSTSVRVFREEGASGKSLDCRPQVLELIREIECGRVEGILCFSLDRLSRSIRDFCRLFDLCEQYSTKIISVSQKFDTSTATGRLCLNVLLCFSQFEREAIVDRVVNAVQHLRRNGYWTGGRTPYGYERGKDASGQTILQPNPERAEHVRLIFRTVRDTRSLSATTRLLDRLGITRADGKAFDIPTVDRVVRSRIYLGELSHAETTKIGGQRTATVTWTKARHEPLITPELFEAVAQVVYRKTKQVAGSKKTNRVFPLQGLLHCTHCRLAFTPSYAHHAGRNASFTFYYRCLGATKRGQRQAKCPFHNLNAEKIEAEVIRVIGEIADDHSGWLDEICRKIRTTTDVAVQHLETERQAIVAERHESASELVNLTNFIKRSNNAPTHLAQEIERLDRRIQALDMELAEKDRMIQAAAPVQASAAEIRKTFGRLSELLRQGSPTRQQTILRLFIQRIDVTKDGLVLHVYEKPGDTFGSHEPPLRAGPDSHEQPSEANDESSKTNNVWSG